MTRGVAALLFGAVLVSCDRGNGERNSSPPQANAALPPASESLLAAGREKYGEQEFAAARTLWLASLPVARTRGDARAEAELYTWLGLAAWRLGELDSARAWQHRAIELRTQLTPKNDLWRSYNALGLLEMSETRNDSAAALFETALKYATAESSTEGLAKTTGNAALAYGNLGDLRRGRAGHRAMRDAGRKMGDRRVEANGLANEAMVDIWEGDASTAITRLDTARRLYDSIHDAVGQQNALGQLATAYELSGDFGAAFVKLDSALRISRRHSLTENTIEALRLLGGLHLRLGDSRRAVSYYDEAESLARAAGVDADLASVLRGSATASLRLGNFPRARMKGEGALRLHRESEEPLEEIDDLVLLAELEERAGRRNTAAQYLRVAEARSTEIRMNTARATVIIARARLAELRSDPAAVLTELTKLRAIGPLRDAELQATSDALATGAYLRIGAVDSAVAVGARAVHMVDRVRRGLTGDAITSTYVADRADVYGSYVVALLRAGENEAAFAVADRARSRSLLEHLTEVRARRSGAGVPTELIESETVLRRIDALMEALARSAPPPSGARGPTVVDASTAAKLDAARAEYERLIVRASQRNAPAAAVLGTRTVALQDVRNALEPREVLLEYFIGEDTLYFFVVRREGLRVIRTAVNADVLSQRVRLLKDLWGTARADWRVGLGVSGALGATLIEPVRNAGLLNGATHLVIVPHGLIAQVPFAGLHDRRTGRFAVQDFALTQSPSSSAFVALRSRPRPANLSSAGAEALAPFPRELPGSARETEAFVRFTSNGTRHLGAKASESALRAALARGAIIHVATHGVLNFRNPMFSRVDLAPRNPRAGRSLGTDNDGRLEVRELLGIDVRSPFVFLSGCETGSADDWSSGGLRTTGDLTLSQALLSAGALNVASALWRIDDAGAALFGEKFYSALRTMTASDALAAAQRSLANNPKFGSPYYWAAYVLSGEGRTGGRPQSLAQASVE